MLLLGSLLAIPQARGTTNLVTGVLTQDTTWSGTNWLQGTVVVTNGVVLTIEPGTRLLMNTGATLMVYGQLLAQGTSNAPIWFTRATSTAKWKRLMFLQAQASALRHCLIEYADCAGDHQDYYPTGTICNPPTFRPRTNYHEAVVALACHLEIENCVFRNLLGGAGGNEGDAIAIISDHPDPTNTNSWNSASATVRSCRFDGIGQAIHTRYAYVLVEHCYFANKHGDNDDVDLYGESSPPPLIRYNIFMPGHEDKINPTRCSAIIIGNIVSGSDDHGIVLRDKCAPVVMNNVIYDCTSACISVQNQCNALIVNNTLRNSARGIRFFDHFDRHRPPYCLSPGSGRATILNCTIWDCTEPLTLTDSTNGHSYASIAYGDVEGGRAAASVSANSTLIWDTNTILNLDPQFVGLATNNFRLLSNSPCLDAGTNLSAIVTHDFDGVPRPLDSNGDGLARFDLGAFEYLLSTADSNGDGIPDGWTWRYGLNPVDPTVASGNPDDDPHTTYQEWVADTDPTNALSHLRITGVAHGPPATVQFQSSSNRQYTLYATRQLAGSNTLSAVPGQVNVSGTGGTQTLADTNAAPQQFYRIGVRLP